MYIGTGRTARGGGCRPPRSGKVADKTKKIGLRSNVSEKDISNGPKGDGRKEKAIVLSDIKLNDNVTTSFSCRTR
jgi:hypothetical protein